MIEDPFCKAVGGPSCGCVGGVRFCFGIKWISIEDSRVSFTVVYIGSLVRMPRCWAWT